jgi:hypothetical protein
VCARRSDVKGQMLADASPRDAAAHPRVTRANTTIRRDRPAPRIPPNLFPERDLETSHRPGPEPDLVRIHLYPAHDSLFRREARPEPCYRHAGAADGHVRGHFRPVLFGFCRSSLACSFSLSERGLRVPSGELAGVRWRRVEGGCRMLVLLCKD